MSRLRLCGKSQDEERCDNESLTSLFAVDFVGALREAVSKLRRNIAAHYRTASGSDRIEHSIRFNCGFIGR